MTGMQAETETAMEAELRARIQADARAYGGTFPREAVIAWEGCLAALIEWGRLSADERAPHAPCSHPSRTAQIHILIGREEADE
jgi:hypothetical protein